MRASKLAIGGLIALVSALSGCGGGGGGASTPQPTVTASAASSKVASGKNTTITWSSSNATSCTASGAWSGAQATSGSATVTPTSTGANAYTITCSGAGGTAAQTINVTVPIPVQASSYLNAKNIGLAPITLPNITGNNPVSFIESTEMITAGFTVGDFFQDGQYSLVAFTNNFFPTTDPKYGRTAGHVYFYKKDANGKWVDHTSDLLADQTGCISPRKLIVADFNGDGVPDVFAACHGIDQIPLTGTYTLGEHPRMLLSQPDGKYKNIDMGFNCYCHSAAAADFNGNGFADIVVTDTVTAKQPFFLVNNKDGTFTKDLSKVPASTIATACNGDCAWQIFSVELLDINSDGKLDLVLMGNEWSQPNIAPTFWPTTIFLNPGNSNFPSASSITIPGMNATDDSLHNPLDVVLLNGALYFARVNGPYTKYGIQKVDLSTMASTTIYSHDGSYTNGSAWAPWIAPYQGKIQSFNAAYPIAVTP